MTNSAKKNKIWVTEKVTDFHNEKLKDDWKVVTYGQALAGIGAELILVETPESGLFSPKQIEYLNIPLKQRLLPEGRMYIL